MDHLSFFILNVAFNSLLAFLTALVLIEVLIGIFQIKQGRCASYLRMIPILKLILDPFLYDFSRWSYSLGINPLNCEEGTRAISAMFGTSINDWSFHPLCSGIQMTVYEDLTFTVADVIGHLIPLSMLRAFATTFTLVTGVIIVKRLAYYFACAQHLRHLNKLTRMPGKKIRNSKLASFVKKYPLSIITSPDLQGSPFVTGLISSAVFISRNLSLTLSQKEYEAALAHEIEHVRHKDSLVRLTLALICSIFWWVPTGWLRNKIEEGQEIGCDLQCKKYGVNPVDLASAICKSAKQIPQDYSSSIFAYHLAKKYPVQKRIKALLALAPSRLRKTRTILAACAVCVAFFGVLFGRYWIF